MPEDFKTRLKIAKSKIKNQYENDKENVGHLWVMPSNWAQSWLQQF